MARLLIDCGADVRYVGSACPATPWNAHDAEWLRGLVTQLTQSHEAARERPWQVTDAPADYIDSMLKAIVGIEIPISRLEGKWKLSQNRLPQDREGVINALSEQRAQGDPGSAAMLREMGVVSVKPA